jgi:hypothetical protein
MFRKPDRREGSGMNEEKRNPEWCSKKIHFVNESERERYTNLTMSIKLGYNIPIGTIVNEALELYVKELKMKSKKPKGKSDNDKR